MYNPQRALREDHLMKEEHNRFKQLFFIVWPAAAFSYALLTMHSKSSRFIVILFYGLCSFFYPFSFSDDIDVVRHAERFRLVADMPMTNFLSRVTTLYVSEANKPDIFQPFIEFVVSRFTDDYRIYFAVLGLFLGYFLMQLMKVLYEGRENTSRGGYALLLLLFIMVLLPPYRIAGFRQIVGTLCFCIGTYQVLVNNKKQYHFLVATSCLVHFGFFAVMPFYILYFIVGNRLWIYFPLIIVAFLLRDQATNFIYDAGTDLQGQLGLRIRGYTSDDYLEKTAVITQSQLGIIRDQMPFTAYFFFILLLYFFVRGYFKQHVKSKSLYAMALSVFIFLTFISDLHNTLVRFSLLFVILATILTIRVLYESRVRSLIFRILLIGVIAVNSVVMVRKSIEFTAVQVLVPNIIMGFFMETDATVLDIIDRN